MNTKKFFYIINLQNRDYITLVEYICSANMTISPILLVFRVNILQKKCQHNNLNSTIVIDLTETSYANNNTALEQLQNFINYIQNKRQSACFLLIIASYCSYITLLFYNLATKNKIVLFHFLSYSRHFIQLLDIGIFQCFKYYYTHTIDKAVQFNDEKFSKLEFLTVFQLFCNQIFKSKIIRYFFK